MKASDWISVKDRLPDIGIRVIVCHYLPDGSKSGQIARREETPYEVFWCNDYGNKVEYITQFDKVIDNKRNELRNLSKEELLTFL